MGFAPFVPQAFFEKRFRRYYPPYRNKPPLLSTYMYVGYYLVLVWVTLNRATSIPLCPFLGSNEIHSIRFSENEIVLGANRRRVCTCHIKSKKRTLRQSESSLVPCSLQCIRGLNALLVNYFTKEALSALVYIR